MKQYAAIVGLQVAQNLEGLARARLEKRPRQYQSDAAVHQAYLRMTAGGDGPSDGEGADDAADDPPPAPQLKIGTFEELPRLGMTSSEDFRKTLTYGHRTRLRAFEKELLALPCMDWKDVLPDHSRASHLFDQGRGEAWRQLYRGLHDSMPDVWSGTDHVDKQLHMLKLQDLAFQDKPAGEDESDDEDEAPGAGDGKDPEPASFDEAGVHATPSAYIMDLVAGLPEDKRLTRDQIIFAMRFADACDQVWRDEKNGTPCHQRKVHHILLLGQGGSGKTHVVQELVFKAVNHIWPEESKASPSLVVAAFSNAQAKNISTADVEAMTIHRAGGMAVQELTNDKMRPSAEKLKKLVQHWRRVRVLVMEEISMISAGLYNMLDFRSMFGRGQEFAVDESNYRKEHHHFGRVPIVIHLGDFLQLSPTKAIGLIRDVQEKDKDGNYKLDPPPSVEVQHAIRVFGKVPHVIELKGTKRFKPGDPLIELLACMRFARQIPDQVWAAFQARVATDCTTGVRDPRHDEEKFATGFGMAWYWSTLVRWMSRRSMVDSRTMGVPLVFLQSKDEGVVGGTPQETIEACKRLLNVPNPGETGHMHGVLPAHVGMEVRFTDKVSARKGLIQEQKATIVSFVFESSDQERYDACAPGEIFRPRFLPAGIWMQVHKFEKQSPDVVDALMNSFGIQKEKANGLFCFPLMEAHFKWKNAGKVHRIKRYGYALTHGRFLTSTASQGQTIRTGVTIDCAQDTSIGSPEERAENWWLHLYVMLSRATCMDDMLLLRPPPREVLQKGPPPSVLKALQKFDERMATETQEIEDLALARQWMLPAA